MTDRLYVTDTWEDSPAKRELVDYSHRISEKLERAEQRLREVRGICEWNRCDLAARQILLYLDGQETPLAALLLREGRAS